MNREETKATEETERTAKPTPRHKHHTLQRVAKAVQHARAALGGKNDAKARKFLADVSARSIEIRFNNWPRMLPLKQQRGMGFLGEEGEPITMTMDGLAMLTAKLHEARIVVSEFYGAEYSQTIQPFRDALNQTMDNAGVNVLEAAIASLKIIHTKGGNGMMIGACLAAAGQMINDGKESNDE